MHFLKFCENRNSLEITDLIRYQMASNGESIISNWLSATEMETSTIYGQFGPYMPVIKATSLVELENALPSWE